MLCLLMVFCYTMVYVIMCYIIYIYIDICSFTLLCAVWCHFVISCIILCYYMLCCDVLYSILLYYKIPQITRNHRKMMIQLCTCPMTIQTMTLPHMFTPTRERIHTTMTWGIAWSSMRQTSNLSKTDTLPPSLLN